MENTRWKGLKNLKLYEECTKTLRVIKENLIRASIYECGLKIKNLQKMYSNRLCMEFKSLEYYSGLLLCYDGGKCVKKSREKL